MFHTLKIALIKIIENRQTFFSPIYQNLSDINTRVYTHIIFIKNNCFTLGIVSTRESLYALDTKKKTKMFPQYK